MMELTEEMIVEIRKQCRRIGYGSITIHLREEANTIDIEVNERRRFAKDITPAPGKVIMVKKVTRLDT
jgi:hypothetical protein